MKANSLRFRVTAWYCGLLAVTLFIFGAAVWLGLRSYLFDTIERSLRDDTGNIVQQFVSQVDQKSTNWLAGEIEESYAPESDGRYIRIFRNGRVLYESRNAQAEALRTVPLDPGDDNKPDGYMRSIATRTAGRMLLYTRPWVSPAGVHYVVQVGAPSESVDRILSSLLLSLSLLTPLILAGAAVGGYFLMGVPFRPVVALTRQAEQIGTRDLGERLPVIPTGDEMERLSISLNHMIERLEDALAHNRRFSADVSHELRTPLTILRGELEPLVESPDLPPRALDAVGSSLEEILRMSNIVESLLEISKLDEHSPITRSPVNLAAIAASTVEQMQLLAEDKQLTVATSLTQDVWVQGDRVRLQQVIANLLDNAIKYTPPGRNIRLAVSAEKLRGVIEISDDGVGIPAECIPFVFDRFYRADKARSRESGGTGLGLSIVKAICTAHGGSVSLQSREGAGTTVRAELPLCSAEEIPHASFRTHEDNRSRSHQLDEHVPAAAEPNPRTLESA